MAHLNRTIAGAVAAGVLALSACSTDSLSAAGADDIGPCQGSNHIIACVYVDIDGGVFTGPGTLGEIAYQNYRRDLQHGEVLENWWPTIWSNDQMTASFGSDGAGAESIAQYSPPDPMPVNDFVTMQPDIPFIGSNSGNCGSGIYTSCDLKQVDQGDDANFVYQLSNYPVTVEITNNLPDAALTLAGTPGLAGYIADPAGSGATYGPNSSPTPGSSTPTNAQIPIGGTGYFGMYRAFAQQNGFGALYMINDPNSSVYGSMVSLNLVVDDTGAQDSSAGCTGLPASSTGAVPTCSVTLNGGPDGPQTWVVNVSLGSSLPSNSASPSTD